MDNIWTFKVTPDSGISTTGATIEAERIDGEQDAKVPTLAVKIEHQDISTTEKRRQAFDRLYLDVTSEYIKLTQQADARANARACEAEGKINFEARQLG